jgi:hypothetical protein
LTQYYGALGFRTEGRKELSKQLDVQS